MRKDWETYFMGMAFYAAQQSTCMRRKVGAVAVRDKRAIATGYNGAPSGVVDCVTKRTCLREVLEVPSGQRHEICMALHAEQNLIIQSSMFGCPLVGSTVYCTCSPCFICFKMLVNCGVSEIVFYSEYPDEMVVNLLPQTKIGYRKYQGEVYEIQASHC